MKAKHSLISMIGLLLLSVKSFGAPVLDIKRLTEPFPVIEAGEQFHVAYTIANNCGVDYKDLVFDINYKDLIRVDINEQLSTCSENGLADGESCTLIIEGTADKPTQLRPRICTANGLVCSIPTKDQATHIEIKQNGEIRKKILSPDGTRIYTIVGNGVQVIDALTGKLITIITSPLPIQDILVTSDNATLYALTINNVLITDTTTLTTVTSSEIQGTTLILSPDGSILYGVTSVPGPAPSTNISDLVVGAPPPMITFLLFTNVEIGKLAASTSGDKLYAVQPVSGLLPTRNTLLVTDAITLNTIQLPITPDGSPAATYLGDIVAIASTLDAPDRLFILYNNSIIVSLDTTNNTIANTFVLPTGASPLTAAGPGLPFDALFLLYFEQIMSRTA